MIYCFKTGKITYDSRWQANGAASRLNTRRRSVNAQLEAYRCEFCHLFHLGRPVFPKK